MLPSNWLLPRHIIQETKSYLESQGVLLSSFSSKARSDTTILVENIPYRTTSEQIRDLFQPHGELGRGLVPQLIQWPWFSLYVQMKLRRLLKLRHIGVLGTRLSILTKALSICSQVNLHRRPHQYQNLSHRLSRHLNKSQLP